MSFIEDSNENANWPKRAAFLRQYSSVDVHDLEVGDYIISGDVRKFLIERKTDADLIGSLSDGRLFEQAKALAESKDQGFEPIIILEESKVFDIEAKRYVTFLTWLARHENMKKAMWKSLCDLGKFGLTLYVTTSPEDTDNKLISLWKEAGSPKDTDYPLRSGMKKKWSKEQKQKYVLEAFGKEIGHALLKHYGSIAKTIIVPLQLEQMNRSEQMNRTPEDIVQEICNIKMRSGRRIGNVKAQEIYDILFS